MGLFIPNPGTIFWMVIIFGIVLFILKKFAWKPILSALKDREESIAKALNSAEQARKEVEGLKEGNEKIIAEARIEKDIIIKEAINIKEKIIDEAKEKARLETEKNIEQARQQIQAEKTAAVNDIKKQVAELSVMIAEKVIKKELGNNGEQEKLVNGLVDDIKLN
ncbi:MAG: F0F1 ATP synthase subunit B [Prolixibacteraceae bacterium]|jgi:F-type H+-transporting ATPase subunit b|nr:F0F1 ATP synthase subunit B [Prolixibacteraceae bacterium]MBT6006994.1 F0F1 ATP synthase subunit B [Prolixibacteraceae bacterium]MBT6763154.1 F0F1 ATP synthase subunit B [Prolixibacteraceae bacterium]MBT6998972.1 F0F1 ATP synthase subunit B [Prolixibacteraceae bacterium]MBT7393921.1 F0F1 ATP synthase subunit B [Prolixibacteraceae bacterium]